MGILKSVKNPKHFVIVVIIVAIIIVIHYPALYEKKDDIFIFPDLF